VRFSGVAQPGQQWPGCSFGAITAPCPPPYASKSGNPYGRFELDMETRLPID
jgi:hypothetical protein